MKHRTIKALPEYLQPKILSAVAYINTASPNMNKAVERINTLHSHLSEKEVMWAMSLLTLPKLNKIIMRGEEYKDFTEKKKAERTIN